MTYYDCVHASPAGQPAGFVSTPPLAAYYSPRVAAYTEPRPKCDAYGYSPSPSPSPGPRYGHARMNGSEPAREDHFAKRSPRRATHRPSASPRPVTAEDRASAGIPAGYSTKNWDPAEDPIFLLGSVFDANSLGKWIYDWTVHRHGPGTVALVVAGDLWLALIALAGTMGEAECLLQKRKAHGSKRKMIEDFLDDGDELWERLRALLRRCEKSMLRVARRDRGTGQVVSVGASSGCEFVDYVFGEGRGLEETDDLINSMRSWNKRFDYTFKKARSRRTA